METQNSLKFQFDKPNEFTKNLKSKKQNFNTYSSEWIVTDAADASENFVNYSIALEPAFGQIRRLLIQISGLLILQNGSIRMHLEMGAFWETTEEALKKLIAEISEINAPVELKRHHDKFICVLNELEYMYKKTFTMKTDKISNEFSISAFHLKLTNILNILRTIELKSTNATLIDFRQSCCCSIGSMQCTSC